MKMFACSRTVDFFENHALMKNHELCFIYANSNEEARGFAHNNLMEKYPQEKGYYNQTVIHVVEVPKQTEE